MRKNKSRKRKDHVILLVLVSAIAVVFGLRSYFSHSANQPKSTEATRS